MLLLALPGCNKEAPKPTGGTADGEILPGSASDAMLPLDTLRSQPPLAPKVESSGKPADKGDKPAAKGAASEAAAATAEPAEAPAAAAEPAPQGE
jgi:hypothetical protein